ncbi:Peroxisomal biogenesis factor 19, partial [Varanus komodoensis]
ALDDFEKAKPAAPAPAPSAGRGGGGGGAEKPPGEAAKESLFASQEKFFQDLFDSELASQATAEFEKAMKELAEEEPHLVEQFQKLSEAAGRVGSDPGSQQEFTSCLKETLSGLAKNANDLQNSGVPEEELARAMEGLGLEEGEGDGSLLPLMQSIMQNLLSKDVLYPSLKEIAEKASAPPGCARPPSRHVERWGASSGSVCSGHFLEDAELEKLQRGPRKWPGGGVAALPGTRQLALSRGASLPAASPLASPFPLQYPEWLRSHRDSLPQDQYEKYQEQHSIMGKICAQFEAERPTDGDAEQRARFELVLDLMQQLQDLGHPPKELAGESPPSLNFDLEGLNLPEAASTTGEQCRIM